MAFSTTSSSFTSPDSTSMDLSQKLATFCLLFGQRKETAKMQIQSGISLDYVFEELYLLVTSDLCRTLICTGEMNNFHLCQVVNDVNSARGSSDIDDDINPLEQMEMTMVEGDDTLPSNLPHSKHFLCDYLGCGLSYATKRGLSYHRKLHYATQQFCCSWYGCHYSSVYQENIVRHVERVHLNHRSRGPAKEQYRKQARHFVTVAEDSTALKQLNPKRSPTAKRSVSSKVKAQQKNIQHSYSYSKKSCTRLFTTTNKLNLTQHVSLHMPQRTSSNGTLIFLPRAKQKMQRNGTPRTPLITSCSQVRQVRHTKKFNSQQSRPLSSVKIKPL